MPENRPSFVVTDRRKFTLEGELRDPTPDTAEEPRESVASPASPSGTTVPSTAVKPADTAAVPLNETPAEIDSAAGEGGEADEELGPAPTAQESADQHAAYQKSSGQIDEMLRQSNPGAPASAEMDFDQLVQSIYLSAVMAMGAGTEPGQKPRVDIIGARQSIDMLGVLSEKTKGNLTDRERKLLDTALFNLRMMFLEITNSITTAARRPTAPQRP